MRSRKKCFSKRGIPKPFWIFRYGPSDHLPPVHFPRLLIRHIFGWYFPVNDYDRLLWKWFWQIFIQIQHSFASMNYSTALPPLGWNRTHSGSSPLFLESMNFYVAKFLVWSVNSRNLVKFHRFNHLLQNISIVNVWWLGKIRFSTCNISLSSSLFINPSLFVNNEQEISALPETMKPKINFLLNHT